MDVSPGLHVDLGTIELKPIPTVRVSGRVDDDRTGRRELIMRRLDLNTGDAISQMLIPVHRNGTFSAPQGRFVFDRAYKPVPHDVEPHVYVFPQGPDAWLRQGLAEGGILIAGETFRVEGIIGSHRIDARAPLGWIVDGVILEDGRNALDTILEFEPGRHYADVRVLLSSQAATIEGQVEQHLANWPRRVSVFPIDESLWGIWRYQHQAEIDAYGSFRIEGITPAREYYVATCEWPCRSLPEDLEARVKDARRVYIDRPAVFRVDLRHRD